MKALLESTEVPRKLDKLAILLSGTCLLHCLALPLLVTLVPKAQLASQAHKVQQVTNLLTTGQAHHFALKTLMALTAPIRI